MYGPIGRGAEAYSSVPPWLKGPSERDRAGRAALANATQ
jgi:hypothetical protein